MDKLTCMEHFVLVAKLGSFTLAANELNTTQGAISKKIAWLETEIGFPLFHRSPRKIVLTDSGKEYLDFSTLLLEQLNFKESKIKGELSEVTGILKLSVPSAFATQQLAEPVSRFIAIHSKVSVNISVSDRQADLIQDDIDVAIRVSHLKDSGLKARKLIDHHVCYFASPDYLKRFGQPDTPQELVNHQCITYSLSSPSNVWTINGKKFLLNERITSDSPEMIVEMVKQGDGIGAMPKWMIEKDLDSKALVEVFNRFEKPSLPMYLVYKDSNYLPYRIRAFIDFMVEYFQ